MAAAVPRRPPNRAPGGAGATAPESALADELRFLRVLWGLDHALQVTSKLMRTRMGITAPQRLTLRIVGAFGEIGAGDVAALLHLHPATLTGIFERLVSRGYLRKSRVATDGRRTRLSLTAKGRRLTNSRAGTVESAVRTTIAAFSARELRATRDVLSRLALELAKESEPETLAGKRTDPAGARRRGRTRRRP